jgi:hypothetical protein
MNADAAGSTCLEKDGLLSRSDIHINVEQQLSFARFFKVRRSHFCELHFVVFFSSHLTLVSKLLLFPFHLGSPKSVDLF